MAAMTNIARNPPQPRRATFGQQQRHSGLLVSKEREDAAQRCKLQVEEITKDCREKNSKFRDIEFDLEFDQHRCLYGLEYALNTPKLKYNPLDVQRVTQIFDRPVFFKDGVSSNDIFQGAIGDCWFCSALATMSAARGLDHLVEECCIARDEQVGVYGFIFFRDTRWVVVIIDDLLYTRIPIFEGLTEDGKMLYLDDKELYNTSARKGGKGLYFARSGARGDSETWVPLIEKAYAKLHGCYGALESGQTCEAIEDMTGGVSSFFRSRDILDQKKFWEEELLLANRGKLFGCIFSTPGGDHVHGLIPRHAYSVLRAVECEGIKFVVVRNPHGKGEWTGRWSDGSKEWTPDSESMSVILKALGHKFGDDGQFVMEYGDFLQHWEYIDRVLLFDSQWQMSSQWLRVTSRPLSHAWTFGDVSFTIKLDTASKAIIVLSQLDDRYYMPISDCAFWSFDFIVFRKGEKIPITRSSYSRHQARSVNVETNLEAGVYVVHVRLDRQPQPEEKYVETVEWEREREHSRVLTEKAKSQSIASNITAARAKYLPIPLDVLAGQDVSELEVKVAAKNKKNQKHDKALMTPDPKSSSTFSYLDDLWCYFMGSSDSNVKSSEGTTSNPDEVDEQSEWDAQESSRSVNEKNVVYLGLRVYTQNTSVEICGQLRHEMATSFEGLAIPD